MKMMSRKSPLTTMSRGLFMMFALTMLFATTDLQAAAGGKTGVVDVSRVIKQMPETTKAENILKSTTSQWGKALEQMQKDFQSGVAAYEKNKASMNTATKTQKENELKTKLQAAQKYEKEKFGRGGALEKKQEELMKPIRLKVLAAIKAVAQKDGFSLIMEKQAMVYGDSDLDITIKVIDQLNKK
ncbi:MAG: OmpH family outer membrane protein [Prosthecochloris sp.]|uniref:Outer membrane chaperone Skp (OmpH) n=1 Tax=Prosthecochloris aestuarii (strain DSM 271 / SK 413) TaxID=290512 RepID=B4S4U0_PROA2|nr:MULTISPECIES: OmpH family outer membrane protein [Prosthecochloris]ACF45438.1 outer membrane chaperone Skp (OmpH) [Prosthecochloris aestuarii DSM 271]MCW8798017.1 OmpH family outer membrane protein [Prosthecochloris sp.]